MNLPSLSRLLAKLNPAVQAVLFAAFTALLLTLLDQVSRHFGVTGWQRIIDDIGGGIIAGLVVYAYARLRTDYIETRLRTVELMNHHIRNALQVIRYAGYIQPESQQVAEVDNAIHRIDWALREILTGQVTTYGEKHDDDPSAAA